MKEEIVSISENTRKRKIDGEWKLEQKDPIKGVWCIHPVQFFHDNEEDMVNMFEEMEKERKRIEKELYSPKKVKEFLLTKKEYFDEEEYPMSFDEIKNIEIEKVVYVKFAESFRETHYRIVFDATINGCKVRWIAEDDHYSGDFYSPPDYEFEIQKLDERIGNLDKYIKGFLTINKEKRESRKLDSKEKVKREKERLKRIIWKNIELRDELEKIKEK